MDKELVRLVKKCFSLDQISLKRFEEEVNTVFVDETLKKYINKENNYRLRVPLGSELKNKVDNSWIVFQTLFYDTIEKYDITYEDYSINKKSLNKNVYKIFKLIKLKYSEKDKLKVVFNRAYTKLKGDDFDYIYKKCKMSFDDSTRFFEIFFDKTLEYLNELRTTKSENSSVVISKNYNDFFLSATKESWRTCMSVESPSFAAYWASLPGSVIDKNLYMIYLTNGSKKDYMGVKIDKVVSRSWLLLDKDSNLNAVKFYPNNDFNLTAVNETLPFNIKRIDFNFVSKYRVEPLFYKNGYSCYIYQDKTEPVEIKDNSFLMRYGKKGMHFLHNNRAFEGPIFHYQEGLKELDERDREILSYFRPTYICDNCGCEISFSREKADVGNYILCRDCSEDDDIFNNFEQKNIEDNNCSYNDDFSYDDDFSFDTDIEVKYKTLDSLSLKTKYNVSANYSTDGTRFEHDLSPPARRPVLNLETMSIGLRDLIDIGIIDSNTRIKENDDLENPPALETTTSFS